MKFDPKDSGKEPQKDTGEDQPVSPEKAKTKDEEKDMEKSLTTDDLQKSLDKLADFVNDGDDASRKEHLLQKALSDDLSVEENEELIQLMGGMDTVQKSDAGDGEDPITKSFTDNEPLSRAVEVSAYLTEQHDALTKSLSAVRDEIEKSDHRRHEFGVIQARALLDMGQLIKSMHETMEQIANLPVRDPKSRGANAGGARPLLKSFAGDPPAGEQLSRSDVMATLEAMNQESLSKSMGGRLASGEDLTLAITKFETSGDISPRVLKAVKDYRANNQAAH